MHPAPTHRGGAARLPYTGDRSLEENNPMREMRDSRVCLSTQEDDMTEPTVNPVEECRSLMQAQLAAMSAKERHHASNVACTRLVNTDAFRHASVVMLYLPTAAEVDTTPAAIRCFQMGMTVCVPRVNWRRRETEAIEVNSFDDHFMEIDKHGLRAPRNGSLIVPESIDTVILPGLAFDADGFRIGRGHGFYERMFARLRRSATTIGMVFDVQIVDAVPSVPDSLRVHQIATDRRVIQASSARAPR